MPFLLAITIGLVVATELNAQGLLPRGYLPPGQLIDVGGRQLHFYCSGKGSPTVILIAGARRKLININKRRTTKRVVAARDNK